MKVRFVEHLDETKRDCSLFDVYLEDGQRLRLMEVHSEFHVVAMDGLVLGHRQPAENDIVLIPVQLGSEKDEKEYNTSGHDLTLEKGQSALEEKS